jgi:predicted transposase YbfD/YdcC
MIPWALLIRSAAMIETSIDLHSKSRLARLLHHFGEIPDPRDPRYVAHPLPEIMLLVVCGTICDCEDYDLIADWGEAHLAFLRRFLPYHHGVPCGRWLNIMINRTGPALFQAAFTAWVGETWPQRPDLIAIKPAPAKAGGKTSRRSHDRAAGVGPLHLVSAFATTARLVLGQEAVAEKSGETAAIPVLLDRLAAAGGIAGALISIDAIATNAAIANAILENGADYLLAVKANQATIAKEIERYFADAPEDQLASVRDADKGHGRIEERTVTVSGETAWLAGGRRFPGEFRLPAVKTVLRVAARTHLKDHCRAGTRYYISSRRLSAAEAAKAVRGHWAIENSLHWTLDAVFHDDLRRNRKGHGALNMAIVRHFAFNLVRALADKRSLKNRRKRAGWDTEYLTAILGASPC